MKAQVEQLAEMSETLESAGFSRPKSNAVIESVAMAMETFAVTPELLDDRVGGLKSRFDGRFNELENRFDNRFNELENRFDNRFNEMESRFDNRFNELESRFDSRIDRFREETKEQFAAQAEDIKALRQSMKQLEQAMFDLKGSMMRFMMGFTLLMLSAVAGVFGTIIARIFL